MSLTLGTGPFGQRPGGSFNVDVPREGIVYVEDFPRRMRARLGGRTVIDSTHAKLLHEHGRLPVLFFPEEDMSGDGFETRSRDEVPGHVEVDWHVFDEWLEEDQPAFGHVRDPYHRTDALASSRYVVISLRGDIVADTRRAHALFETGLPTRWYLPPEDVRAELEPSDTRTTCAYKGQADHFSIHVGDRLEDDIAWTYRDPTPGVAAIRGLVAFYNERVDVTLDGEPQERPRTPWSRD